MNNEIDIKKVFDPEKLLRVSNSVVATPDTTVTPMAITEIIDSDAAPAKRKRGRPRKSETENTEVTAEPINVPLCQTNAPYQDSYAETDHLLRESIGQINLLSNDVQAEIENIRKSKTLKGKYKYISELCSTASTLVSTKISAIREMNATTTKCHELEIKRLKDIKAAQAQNQQDDDKYMADLYNAYISTPVNSGAGNPLLAMSAGNTINNNALMMGGTVINGGTSEEQQFQNFMSNLTPEQNRMIMSGNPNIETVVVYDPATGSKAFDVIDITTGIPVPNYPRPDSLILDDTIIDFATGVATNSNIGQNWKVVTLGDPTANY